LETVGGPVDGVSGSKGLKRKGKKGAGAVGFGGPGEVAVVAIKCKEEKDLVFLNWPADSEPVHFANIGRLVGGSH
jgi:hypothetical protein